MTMQKGFTLIELVIAIVLLGLGVTALITLILNTTQHSIDPMIQQQAHSIAQSYMEEILTQPFCDPDFSTECSDDCTSATACTTCNTGEVSRNQFDAVCDYDGLNNTDGAEDFNENIITGLEAYNISVTVVDSGVTLGTGAGQLSSASGEVVRLDVNVTHDDVSDLDITLQAFKTNF